MENKKRLSTWLKWAIAFLGLALISSVLGFGLIPGVMFDFAKRFAMIFGILFVIFVIADIVKKV